MRKKKYIYVCTQKNTILCKQIVNIVNLGYNGSQRESKKYLL
jgi:hypothetical protein